MDETKYVKHEFKSGDKLYAAQLNEMDEQIVLNETNIDLKADKTEIPTIDSSLSLEGAAADAKKTGEEINRIDNEVDSLSTAITDKANKSGWTADKYIGTDRNGNLIEKDAPTSSETQETWTTITPVWNEGKYLADGGKITDYESTDWVVSDPIPVTVGEVYKITAGIKFKKAVLVFYDSEESFVSQIASTTDDAYTFTDTIVTVPETAAYMRVGNVTTIATFSLHRKSSVGGLGEPTDTDVSTICGCINTTIDNLYAILPTVQLGIVTPTPWEGYNPSNAGNNMDVYSEAIVEICKLRGIPCLDLYHCSGLRPWEEAFRNVAYTKSGDGVHPDETGHAIIAPRIKAFLNSLII